MRIAFHAPLKPADHPVPSGDRGLARGFIALLARLGHQVDIASTLRSLDREGDGAAQARLIEAGQQHASDYINGVRRGVRPRPDLWFTYHLHYRAPDLVGPEVARALDLPYVVAEPSYSAPRATGPWAAYHDRVKDAIRLADGVLCLTRRDQAGVEPLMAPGVAATLLPPFVEDDWLMDALPAGDASPRLVVAAMMRARWKLDSFQFLADALRRLDPVPPLTIAGDGPARAAVEALFAGLPARFTGLLAPAALRHLFAQSGLFVWPAVHEAFGMALLEAQASGLPVLAGDHGAVAEVVTDGGVLLPPGDAGRFADAIQSLLDDGDRRRQLGQNARAHVRQNHSMAAAAPILAATIEAATRRRAQCPRAS